jgi:site-specific DNA-methyltransferase (adenine-specific)
MTKILELGAQWVDLHHGDMLGAVDSLPDNSVDSVVTDPPYHLTSIVKRFGATSHSDNTHTSARVRDRADGYARAASGFMGKQWDGGDIAFQPDTWAKVLRVLKPGGHIVAFGAPKNAHRLTCAIEDAGFEIRDSLMWVFGTGFPKSHNLSGEYEGWGTALKPAYEPIILARKPLIGTVAENVLRYGTGAINIDACRVGTEPRSYAPKGTSANAAMIRVPEHREGKAGEEVSVVGRWPANLVHDGSEEVLAAFPDAPGQQRALLGGEASKSEIYGKFGPKLAHEPRGDAGSAARFFYSAKASKSDRIGSKHPTVKPVELMKWLVRLITPKGGVVLDPFAGSGTTGEAALLEGMRCILVEREDEYVADIKRRMELAVLGPEDKKLAVGKILGKDDGVDLGPLFDTRE